MAGDRMGRSRRPTNEDIAVLFVDDNREWAELAASRIEREAEEIDVTVAGSANEAMVTLRERDDLDCLLADYMMPRVTGLQLLERVREEYPRLPYLLTTSEGSEDVAARAIDAGVSDYIVKDPAGDQTVVFVSRIRSAVEQYRLRQVIEESETRYRTVTEQSRDGVAILRQGRVLFSNQRLADLAGWRRESLYGTELVEEAVHSADRDRVRSVIEGWGEGETRQVLHAMRIVRPDGSIRNCEFTGRRITYDNDPATLLSIRDVTDRQRRERELEWERDLNRTVHEAFVESGTRKVLEREVVEQLHRYGYTLAWLAEGTDGSLAPRVVEGDQGYVDARDWTVADGETESEPILWAARTGEPQFVPDFADLFPTEWRATADAHGFRSGAAIPLVYNDVRYGVLGVYHDQPDRFDDTERTLLTELADTVAFAIHSLETQSALAADSGVNATVQVADDAYYLVALARDSAFHDADSVSVKGTVSDGEGAFIQYLAVEGDGDGSVRAALGAHPQVTDVVQIDAGERTRLQVHVSMPVPEAMLAARGVIVHSTTIEANGATLSVEFPDRELLNSTVDALEDSYDSVSVLAISDRETASGPSRPIHQAVADLTDKQAQALQAAYYHGYFEQPRGNTASAIADSLGISHSTFLQHLHRAQQKLFAEQFD